MEWLPFNRSDFVHVRALIHFKLHNEIVNVQLRNQGRISAHHRVSAKECNLSDVLTHLCRVYTANPSQDSCSTAAHIKLLFTILKAFAVTCSASESCPVFLFSAVSLGFPQVLQNRVPTVERRQPFPGTSATPFSFLAV